MGAACEEQDLQSAGHEVLQKAHQCMLDKINNHQALDGIQGLSGSLGGQSETRQITRTFSSQTFSLRKPYSRKKIRSKGFHLILVGVLYPFYSKTS